MALIPLGPDQHRLALAAVAAASAVALTFGLLSVSRTISKPFESKGAVSRTYDEREREAEQALKVRDTDGDGLSDYDELKIYRTSPYIADTDSDGISDGVEVKNGDDPNCPAGRVCQNSSAYVAPPAKANPADLLPKDTESNPLAALQGLTSTDAAPLDPGLLAGFDAKKIRTLLKASGVAQGVLDKLTDSQLEAIYKETLAEQVPTSTAGLIRTTASGTP